MTELIVSRGDTFPRSFLDTYRANRTSEYLYNDLSSSKSDELVLQTSSDIPVSSELQHGHSENLLDSNTGTSGYKDYNCPQSPGVVLPKIQRKVPLYDKVDPEDSIRDIITENDFYR